MVRTQILNPERKILSSKGVSQNLSLPVGYYLVNQPLFAKGILVVFELRYNEKREKHGVILNHPNIQDFVFYTNLSKYDGVKFTLEKEDFLDLDFLTEKENIIAYHKDINKQYNFNLSRLGLDFVYRDLE